ncbi:MAG: hypothetical protein JNK77_20700 [Saprospiraceae bacterium]|nr:hypothetical protein [Saprospiraceae bacterium]
MAGVLGVGGGVDAIDKSKVHSHLSIKKLSIRQDRALFLNLLTFAQAYNFHEVSRFDRWLLLAFIAVLPPALLINLGLPAFIDDEGIRSLVALEMKLSGNYIVPTLNGVYYYNKPPLYNWILLAAFELSGRVNELVARIPTVLCLLGYAATMVYYFRKHYGLRTALLNAVVMITCGRILFWDSLLGLIDICFSWVMFTMFMVIFHQFRKGRFYQLFFLSYLLCAIGFLMKGLPAMVFQVTTLFVYFAYWRRLRRFFSTAHVVGGLTFLFVVGAYYLAYHQYNSLENVFGTLFVESSKRTVTHNGWTETVKHLFTFPFEMVYHFLPWSLLVIYLFKKGIYSEITKDPFIAFNLIAFLSNIIVYWTSPAVYPRYLLMLAPLLFSVFIYLHDLRKQQNAWQYRFLEPFFGVLCGFIALAWLAPPFMDRLDGLVNYIVPKTAFMVASLGAITYFYWTQKERRLLLLALFLLVFRIGFNWFVLPDRNANDFGDLCRDTSIEVGREFAGKPLLVYGETEMQITNSFYITNAYGAIVRYHQDPVSPDAFYIIDPKRYPDLKYRKVAEFKLRHDQLTFDIGVIKQ